MTTPHTPDLSRKEPVMFDQSIAEALLYRVAVVALGYYPTKPAEEHGYTIDEDLDWCLQVLDLPATQLSGLRDTIRDVITDPTRHRHQFVRDLMNTVPD